MLSVIIPARNEIYLEKTIRNILENATGKIEIIAILDGYIPSPQIVINDDRVIFLHNKEARGQRQSINQGAKIAKGKYIMKLDAHSAVDKGFDEKLAADCEYDWTVVPRMYNLDNETWLPKWHKVTDYMYFGWNEKNEIRSLYYGGRERAKWKNKPELIDDTMGCMGPGWFMHKDRFWELGGCDEKHGSWGQQGIEVACKAWLSGGSLKVNKKTWFAHWFRGHIGWPYHITQREINIARDYSKDLWLNGKWEKQTRDIKWLLDKFNPPSWENYKFHMNRTDINNQLFQHAHREKHPALWKGAPILKMPSDMFNYHKVIWETKPDFIVEIGTKYGGSALFMQDMLDMNGNGGKVITIDKKPQVQVHDPRITYLVGDSTSPEIIDKVKATVSGKVMLVIDGQHTRTKVKWELHHYSPLVPSGQYVVVEDCYNPPHKELYGPGEARDWFLRHYKEFENTNLDEYYMVGFNLGGWLRRK